MRPTTETLAKSALVFSALAGSALAFVFALEPLVTGAYRLDVLALMAGLTPYVVLSLISAIWARDLRVPGTVGLCVLGLHVSVVLGSADATAVYWKPLFLTLIPMLLLPKACRDLGYSTAASSKET
jgi:hypothetical protein